MAGRPSFGKFLVPVSVLLLVLAAVLVGGLSCGKRSSAGANEPLLCHVGGTMRPVMEELAKLYEKKTGQRVNINYGGSGELFTTIQTVGKGDLYVCHDPFLGKLMTEGLGVQGWTVASLTPMIAVRRDETRVRGLADLADPKIRVGLTDAKYSSAGHIVNVMLDKSGLRKQIEANIRTRTRQGAAAANAVIHKQLDAVIVWNAVIHARREHLKAVQIEHKWRPAQGVDARTTATYGLIEMDYTRVTIATLKCATQPEAAKAFAEFVSSPASQAVFARHGFSPADASRPTNQDTLPPLGGDIFIRVGAGMRKPIDQLAKEFTAKTGVAVRADYSGSNVLLTTLDTTRRGDVYMPGDADYVEMARAKDLVTYDRPICYFVPVIMVRKAYEDADKIRTLADLARPKLRVGLGDPEAAAVGRLVGELFRRNGVDAAAVAKNLKLQTTTVNELGLHIKLGALDAAIVWSSIAAQYSDDADVVTIPADKNVIPIVAAATLTVSENPVAARAFVDFLASERGQAVLTKHQYVVERPR